MGKIAIKIKGSYHFLEFDKIKYVVCSSYYVEIFMMNNSKFLYRISITKFMEALKKKPFIRVNRSTIININQVKELISEGQGDYSIAMHDGVFFLLSKKYKNNFFQIMKIK